MIKRISKNITIILMIIILSSFLTGCSFISQLFCKHEYNETLVDATCTQRGYTLKECTICGFTTKSDYVIALGHKLEEVVEVVEPTCTEKGYTLKKCTRCNEEIKTDYTDSLGHEYGEYVTVKEPTELEDGYDEAKCIRCDETLKKTTTITNYIDLDVIKYSYVDGKVYDVNNIEEMKLLYNCAILANSTVLKCNIKYDTTFEELMKGLDKASTIGLNYSVQASGETLFGKLKTITITLDVLHGPSTKTDESVYTQYASANSATNTQTRSDDFNNFRINSSKLSYTCETSEQLFYCLSRMAKPICVKDSAAERIYEKAKQVLREIINDDMTDYEKIKAIHDYIVLNVTYDGKLYDLLYEGVSNINQYAGFYLEGVFDDKLAVCEGISKAIVVLCNIEGIPCVSVSGYQTKNPSGAGHAWNKVKIDGTWYVIDATSDGVIINSEFEVLSYEYYLVSEEKMNAYCTANTFTNIKCNSSYDYYSNYKFVIDAKEYDYNIESQEELTKIIKYFETFKDENRTIQFKISFNVGDSPVDEVRLAYTTLFKSAEFSYTYKNNILTLTVSK